MKINKILAAGVAATLAVTSLAAVTSAESREFDMTSTLLTLVGSPKIEGTGTVQLDTTFSSSAVKNDPFITKGGLENTQRDTNGNGVYDDYDFDAYIPVVVNWNNVNVAKLVGDLKVIVKGRKLDGTNYVSVEKTATLMQVANTTTGFAAGTSREQAYILPLYFDTAPAGGLMPAEFDSVDSIEVVTADVKQYGLDSTSEAVYDRETKLLDWAAKNYWGYDKAGFNGVDATTGAGIDTLQGNGGNSGVGTYDALATAYDVSIDAADTTAYLINANRPAAKAYTTNVTAKDVYAFTGIRFANYNKNDATAAAAAANGNAGLNQDETLLDYYHVDPTIANGVGNALIEKICGLVKDIDVTWEYKEMKTSDRLAWLNYTGDYDVVNEILTRLEIAELSTTRAQNSTTTATGAQLNDFNQTYKTTTYNKGTGPLGFAGLASQVADFFNNPGAPRKNATITLHFTAKAAAAATSWKNGGIPSTEVGIRNVLDESGIKDFALFLNYGSTTGSLQAVTKLDASSGSVTFDISDLLVKLGGQTVGTIQDIYYGLNTWATVADVNGDGVDDKGMWVDKVTLAYDDAAAATDAADADIADDADDDADDDDDDADVVADDADDDDDDDDDDATLTDDDDDDDDVANDEDINTPADDDANPGTGAALAVIPAIVAAAAAVVSKKRK